MASNLIERTDRDGIAILTLAHGKASALDLELSAALDDTLRDAERSTAKAIVLTGTGSIFSAGVDLFRVVDGSAADVERFLTTMRDLFIRLFTFPKPTVAAVNGHAIAGGCILACACDYRLMASGPGMIGIPELKVGVPFPAIALEIVRAVVSPPFMQDLVYTGRVCAPDEARRVGLIDDVVPAEALVQRACEIASDLAAHPAASFAIAKEMLRQPAMDRVTAAANSTDRRVFELWSLPATRAAIRAYMEKTFAKR
jgi:enoyl-CoA hydratase/carnithine racemase